MNSSGTRYSSFSVVWVAGALRGPSCVLAFFFLTFFGLNVVNRGRGEFLGFVNSQMNATLFEHERPL